MNRIKLGVRLESFGLPLRQALVQASRLGIAGVQLDAVGDLGPDSLSQTGRRELLHLLRSYNLELTALGCPLRHSLDALERQQDRIDHIRKVMTLSFELGPRIVIAAVGKVPVADDTSDRAARMSEALLALAQNGDRTGTTLALVTGFESGAVLRAFLDRFDSAGLGVNFDPANLLMRDFDPYASAAALQGKVVHCHAKDARKETVNRAAQEVAVGHGDIDWLRLAAVLEEIEYHGCMVVGRESATATVEEMTEAVGFLRRIVG